MLNQRHGSVSGGVVRPSPYTLFDSAARNAWLDNLQRKIQRGLHPQASPGPSRSPSPFEITESRPVELVEAHQDEQDELFGGELEGEHVGVDEGELQELELEYGEPSKSAGGLADNMLGKEIGGTSESGQAPVGAAIHSGDWVDGLEGYVEDHPGREANGYGLSLEPIYENDDHYDEVYDDEDGEDSEEEEEMEEGGEEDAEVQYIGSSMDENPRSSSDDADGSDEEYEKNSEGDSEGDYKPVSIYPQLPGETDDGMEEILQQEPLALPSTCIPPGQGLDYSSQSIYPQLENLPTHVLIPSPAALPADAPFAYGPELVGIPDELVDPALLTEIAQQAEAAIPPAFYPEEIALSMDDAMKEAKEMDGEEEHYEGESFHGEYMIPVS